MILEAALQLLRDVPVEELTMSAVAKHLSVAPMTLYTHVESHQELLAGVSDLILQRLRLEIDPQSSWQDQLRSWLLSVHNHLRTHPWSMRLIDGNSTVGGRWLEVEADLIRILQRSGLTGSDLAYCVRWVAQAAPAAQLLNPALDKREDNVELKSMTRVMDGLGEADVEALQAIVPYVATQDATSTFDFYTARIIDGVMALVEKRADQARR